MSQKVIVIAEAGVNHNGDINLAKQLIDKAADAQVDYIKFQTFKTENLVSKSAKKADYQIKNIDNKEDSQFQMLKKLELTTEQHLSLINYCKEKDVNFFSTAFDLESIDYLATLDLDFFKIPSGEITNYPYLKLIATYGKPIILSTGMANLQEINEALQVLIQHGVAKSDITVLHCNTEYPTPFKDVNLYAMNTIKDRLGVEVGYSDHTLGIEVPIAAVALGAKVIEKHFTLDRSLPGPDHKASLEPNELKSMVSAIRNIQDSISGNGEKVPSESEVKNISIVRKSIHTKRALKSGEEIKESDLIALRPGDGISPMEWDKVVGKKVLNDVSEFAKLKKEDISQ